MMTLFTSNGLAQIAVYFVALLFLARPLGTYIARVYNHEPVWLSRLLSPLESWLYRIAGIHPSHSMSWQHYAAAVVVCSAVGFALLYSMLIFQDKLPFNSRAFSGLDPDLAFNTAVSFVTNTNWQSYSGETTMSYFSQMAGLVVQNFISAAMGMAVFAALARGLRNKESKNIGNFWVDLTRTNLYILLPLSLVLALVLVSQGVVQTFDDYKEVKLLEPITSIQQETGKSSLINTQTIAVGPAASQIAIKQLGTNGGGFFNANSAHPLENPTALSNFIQLLSILLIPAALCFSFGRMMRDTRQGKALWIAMTAIFLPLLFFALSQEQAGNPSLASLGVDQQVSDQQPGGNMEGKEARFSITNSVLWMSATTAASNGSVNSMHDSYTPLGGLVSMLFMQFGEVIYGGVGSGLYGILIFAIVTVFIAGLMVGRSPEYLGKKIQAYEMKMVAIAILIPCLAILISAAIACVTQPGLAGLQEHGPHGLSEILYAFTSAGMNNGSAFAGLTADAPFYNTLQGFAMLLGRFWIMIPTLALAGSLSMKKIIPSSAGTLPTHTPLFIALLIGVIVMIGVLTFVPVLVLGPIVEKVMMP